MSINGSINTVTDNLVFYFDTANIKSYAGEPTTNVIPTPLLNALPTTGNSWGTYNTNQYGSGNYFSIGTISGVSNNIVTTSGNHGLRTYDVMQPQTTGGGVTAGTNYFIKKLSNTTFSLHQYNSSQDGSQGYINPSTGTYKVHDSIYLNEKISINSTSFPNMWWGYPHLPNSGLVKEIITNGFDAIPGNVTDCIRLHWHRADGVTDGMSYGVDCTVTPSTTYTVSFWTRSVSRNAVNKQIQYQNYNYTGGSAAGFSGNFNLGPLGVWQKQSFTFTYTYGTIISYWFNISTGPYIWDLANIQVEQKSHATAFAAGTRSVTQGLLDLTNRTTIDLANTKFDSNGMIDFPINASANSYATTNTNCNLTGDQTLTAWIKPTYGTSSPHRTVICTDPAYQYGIKLMNYKNNARWGLWLGWGSSNYEALTSGDINNNQWKMITGTWKQSTGVVMLYLNGQYVTQFSTGNTSAISLSTGNIWVGMGYEIGFGNGQSYEGKIDSAAIYNRTLTGDETLILYNRTKARYGL
jgi:hypothetical protein